MPSRPTPACPSVSCLTLPLSFQCYKVSCLEIPGAPGPKGYRGQKVRILHPYIPSLLKGPRSSETEVLAGLNHFHGLRET